MSEYKVLNQNQSQDIGNAIQMLMNDNLKKVSSSFLAEITAINNNKVSIKSKLKRSNIELDTIYNNCLVAYPFSSIWQVQYKLNIGDVGIAFVNDDDISNYKKTGKSGVIPTKRFKDRNDSVFVPLSLFNTLPNEDINYIIKSLDNICKLEFDNDNIGIFQAQLLTLKSENTTLKTKLIELVDFLNSAMIEQSPSGIRPFDSTTKANFNSWKNSLDDLFKD